MSRAWAVVQPAYAHMLQPGVRWAREHVARPRRARRERHAGSARVASAAVPIARAAARVIVPAARVVAWPARTVRGAVERTLAPYIDEPAAAPDGDEGLVARGKATAASP